MIASHSYWDLCGLYGIAAGSFYSEAGPLWPTLYAIHDALRGRYFLMFPLKRAMLLRSVLLPSAEGRWINVFALLMALLSARDRSIYCFLLLHFCYYRNTYIISLFTYWLAQKKRIRSFGRY
jgi:hypothetical protein